jgi:hypothetical protein
MKKIEIEEKFYGKDKEEVEEILDMVFNSISRWIIIENKVEDVEYLTSWEHRSNDLIEKDLGELQIDRKGILNALSLYLEKDNLKNKYMDWLFINLLTYAEYIATQAELRKKLLGIDGYIKTLYPASTEHLISISQYKKTSTTKFLIFVSVLVFGFIISPVFGSVILLLILLILYLNLNKYRKLDEILFKMNKTYSFINCMDLNWGFVEEIYKENFKENIIWDTQIYKLIEKSK